MHSTTKIMTAIISAILVGTLGAQELPDKAEILTKMTLANDYFMAKWTDPAAPIVHPDRSRNQQSLDAGNQQRRPDGPL